MNPMRWVRRNTEHLDVAPHRDQPIEVGLVQWGRDLQATIAASALSGKPIFALFQEVPGCAGCKQFGADVLSHPLVVDAIHEAFEPLLIHNNSPGPDAEILARYGEPAWNFQVVRFLGPDGVDVIEQSDRVWETGPLAARMLDALRAVDVTPPPFLTLLEQETSDRLAVIDLAQECFWVGETLIGRLDGVVTTEAGFVEGLEVTRARFDPTQVTRRSIVDHAAASGVASVAFVDDPNAPDLAGATVQVRASARFREAPPSDQKRQLAGRFDGFDLTLAQLTKLNGFASTGSDRAEDLLSRRQLDLIGRPARG